MNDEPLTVSNMLIRPIPIFGSEQLSMLVLRERDIIELLSGQSLLFFSSHCYSLVIQLSFSSALPLVRNGI